MTLATINAADTSPLPEWLAVILLVALFLAVTAAAAFVTYRLRMKSHGGERKNDEKNASE